MSDELLEDRVKELELRSSVMEKELKALRGIVFMSMKRKK